MQLVLLTILLVVAHVSTNVEVDSIIGYHERIAIPLAARIKAAEEAIANQDLYSRIVGGVVSKPNSHPYLAGLLINYVSNPRVGVCAAALVSPARLLTAAHCWFDAVTQASRFVVVLGSHYLFSGGSRIPTSTVVTYPGWTPATSQNNLAVIWLPNPVTLTNNIQPIALATNPEETFVGEWAVAVGYGLTSDQQTSIYVLSVVNEVEVQVITVEDCRRVFSSRAQPNTICTNGAGGVGICRGDGGGPLVVTRDGKPLLIGIGTFLAANGCELGHPSGYSRITSFLGFINQNL